MAPHGRLYEQGMTTLASSPTSPVSTIRLQGLAALAILVAFGGFTLWVMAGHGILGFLTLAGEEPWALQLLLDLVLALSFALGWLRADARKRGIVAWPYYLATLTCGSPALLVYLVHRGLFAPTKALR